MVTFEDDLVIAFADKFPVSNGHTLVIPKLHYADVTRVPVETLRRIIEVSQALALRLIDEKGATGFNIMNANGVDANQSVFHLHFHVVPRFPDDGLDLWFHSRDRSAT